MRSHTYDFTGRDMGWIVGLPLLPVVIFAVLMHAGASLRLLPKPRPTLDVDRTVIVHQADASGSRSDGRILLIGDSSCLIDVNAAQLTAHLGKPVLNLGTLSFLDLNDYATLVRRSVAANPERLQAIVLLMHPEALRRTPGGTYHAGFLRAYLNGEDYVYSASVRDRVSHYLGLEVLRSRVMARLLPTPLPGCPTSSPCSSSPRCYRHRYGFSSELEAFLERNRGSAVELDQKKFEGRAEYWLTGQLETQSRAFRSVVPRGAKLIVGITPVPEGHAQRDYSTTRDAIIKQWSEWLGAEVVLSDLPATMPDDLFAKTTHLNERGAQVYTGLLAAKLSSLLE